MKKNSVQVVLKALNGAGVRYLVVGGLAVNAHGILRFTADMDMIVQLDPENVRRTFDALASIGYRPIVPVTSEGFADPQTRRGWIRDKGMRVLQFFSSEHKQTPVDVFVEEPFPFDREYERALVKMLGERVSVRFVSLDTLVQMKKAAGRAKDLADIEDLLLRRDGRDEEA